MPNSAELMPVSTEPLRASIATGMTFVASRVAQPACLEAATSQCLAFPLAVASQHALPTRQRVPS